MKKHFTILGILAAAFILCQFISQTPYNPLFKSSIKGFFLGIAIGLFAKHLKKLPENAFAFLMMFFAAVASISTLKTLCFSLNCIDASYLALVVSALISFMYIAFNDSAKS